MLMYFQEGKTTSYFSFVGPVLPPRIAGVSKDLHESSKGMTHIICVSLLLCNFNFFLSLFHCLRITANQGFYLLGLNYGSPTFASAMQNSVPAITFVMAAALG